VNQFKVIALTHRSLGLELVGKFHIEAELQKARLNPIVKHFEMREFMFLSTCNRVEFFFRTPQTLNDEFLTNLFKRLYPSLEEHESSLAIEKNRLYYGSDAVRHLFHVASSLDSLVVGEREIITQVRNAFELAQKNGFTKDFIRLAANKALETAKQVYTETEIATKPISVVNLAYRKLIDEVELDGKNIVYVGAGQTIEAIAGNLKKHNFGSVKVFNRTRARAEKLAGLLDGEGFALTELTSKVNDFDVLITCTGAETSIVDKDTYSQLVNGGVSKKTVIDLAVPNDIDGSVLTHFNLDYTSIEDLKGQAKENLKFREKEIFHCEALVEERLEEFEESFRTRKLEIAMNEIPLLMKNIKSQAIGKTFAKEIESLDPESRETLEKIVDYLEKKYISLPMKMAKQVVLDQDLKDPIIE
jgi:glutamyl-tRNA reductase